MPPSRNAGHLAAASTLLGAAAGTDARERLRYVFDALILLEVTFISAAPRRKDWDCSRPSTGGRGIIARSLCFLRLVIPSCRRDEEDAGCRATRRAVPRRTREMLRTR